jgi:hypothetical protein
VQREQVQNDRQRRQRQEPEERGVKEEGGHGSIDLRFKIGD